MLRDYQNDGVEKIREVFARGKKKVLLWLATGGGKTVIFCFMVKGAASRQKKALIIVRGRKLVDQASLRLFREGVEHGVMMAGHWNTKPTLPVQVCSIDTLISWKKKGRPTPPADLIIIDEAHLAISEGYREFLKQYESAFVVSCTATPYVEQSLEHIAEEIVHPITMQGLIDGGHLVPFRYFAPSVPDLTGVKINRTTKDYDQEELAGRMVAGHLAGAVVDHWRKVVGQGLGKGPTLLFAVNVKHSKFLVERFQEQGIIAEHCDADSTDKEREAAIRRLERGETQVICNVGIFCTGVDIPCLRAVILARPTKSYNLYIQQAGRGTRTFPGKTSCILLDHAGNIHRHGFPTMEKAVDLAGTPATESTESSLKTCKQCFCVCEDWPCPACGWMPPVREGKGGEILESDEELSEIEVKAKNPIEQWMEYLEAQRKKTKRKQAWVYYKMVDQFGFEACIPYLPKWFTDRQASRTVSDGNPFANSPFNSVIPSGGNFE